MQLEIDGNRQAIHDFLIKRGQISKANACFEEILLSVENTFVTRTYVKLVRLYWKIKKVARVKSVFND